jgi:hypothetical protein
MANGWGELYLNNNNTLRGLFVNNKLQNFYIEYYSATNNKLIIGPNRESALHGPCISISNEFVSLANYENGQYRGNSDLFQIPPPNYIFNGIFCDADGVNVKDDSQSNLIPNTSLVIYTSAREYNATGDSKYWVSVVDLSLNKLIKKFGSYEKPLTINDAPLFIGFTKENKPIYKYSGKYFQFEIMSGIVNPLSKLPLQMIYKKNNQVETIKKTSYKDLGFISGILDKYKILKDSSYIKMFNSKIYLESGGGKSKRGSGSSLVMFNNKNEIINSLDLPNYNIIDFDIDEQNERIALSYGGKDSICLSYYDLKNFKLISNVFRRNGGDPGDVKFSKSGTYLLYKLNRGYSGTAIYLGNKLYYGIEGDLYDFNNDENVVISNSGNNVFAYDIEKKTIIWTHPIGDDYINTKFFNVENKIYILSGRALSWEGYKVKENGIKLISYTMPKPLFSIQEFVKKPEETFDMVGIAKDKKIENNNLTEKTKSQIKKADDDIFSSYLALMVLSAIFESSNKYSGGSYSSSYNKSESSDRRWNYICEDCNKVKVLESAPYDNSPCPETRWGGVGKASFADGKHAYQKVALFGTYPYACSTCGLSIYTDGKISNSGHCVATGNLYSHKWKK